MSASGSSFASSSAAPMAGKEYALGIDLGTTYSCVAVWKNNKVEVIVNEQGSRITPSCVSFNNDERLIGEGAMNKASQHPTNTVFGIKRLIGRRYNEESVQSDKMMWPFRVEAGDNDRPTVVVQYEGKEKCFTPEEISSMVLYKMKEYGEKFLASEVNKAVITVPAYFNNSQREATKSAGTIAGLDVIQVLNEPTAAALAYGLENKVTRSGKRLLVIFDLGGGTFDVSLLELDEHGVLEVKATAGDTHLGGEDFDNRMVDQLVEVFERKHQNSNIRGNAKCMRRLKSACEKAKRLLSTTMFTEISIDGFYQGEDFISPFSRVKFEQLNRDLFDKCIECLKRCLEDAKVDKGRVDEVVLVGGSTRIPKIQDMLREFFNGKNLNCSINPDEAVAYGAAIQAASLNRSQGHGKGPDVVLLDVQPLSLGIELKGDVMSVVVPRNTRIPCEIEDTYRTAEDNQTSADFCIYEGERPIASDNMLLGQFRLDSLREAPKGEIKFIVTFKIDMNGILKVTAVNEDNWDKGGITITRDKLTLDKDQIDSLIREAKRMEHKDNERKKAILAKHDLEDYLSRIRSKINGFMLSTGSRSKVESAINGAIEWLEDHNDAPIHEYERRKDALRGVIAGINGLNIY